MRLFLFLAIGTQVVLLLPELPGNGSTLLHGTWVVLATVLLGWQVVTYLKRKRHMLYARLGLHVPQAAPGYVRALFDDYAETYDQHLTQELAYNAPEALLESLVPRLNERRLAIADLGCGTGLCGPLFAPYARSLVGIDLSGKMIDLARTRKVYHELVTTDLLDYLHRHQHRFDLCLAADVLVYTGDLRPVFTAVAHSLAAGGYFAFTVETATDRKWRLQSTGRYAHSSVYVRTLASATGFEILDSRPVSYRLQHGQPVPGAIWLLQTLAGVPRGDRAYSNW
ncbi:MAG: methyltransferase domain-containing protein [Gammaproteobacteria bacterium]|nr:methyltransferase domain-containing protein [Gammaproteobacteria bacterium]